MRALLAGLALLLALVSASAQVPYPQDVAPPLVPRGLDSSGLLTSRQITQDDILSSLPRSTSTTQFLLQPGQLVFAIDDWSRFVVGYFVQVTSLSDPTNWAICAIVTLDPGGGAVQCNTTAINGGGIIDDQWSIQVVGGSTLQGVPVWAGIGVDGTDAITNPSAAGQVVTLNVEPGKAFTGFTNVYVWTPNDITTWFLGTILSFNVNSGQMQVFVRQTANTGLTYSTNYVSLVDLSGPDAALTGYSSLKVGQVRSAMAMGAPGSVRWQGTPIPAVNTVLVFPTQSGQFFPIDGQVLASCIGQGVVLRIAGQIKYYNGGNLGLRVTSTFGSGGCSSWVLYLTTGPTTSIGQFQFNGLQVTFNNPNLTVQAGSARDSSNSIDLVLPAAVTLNLNTSPNNVITPALPGTATMTNCGQITGTGTNFLTNFSLTGTLTDFNNSLASQGLAAISRPVLYSSPFVGFLGNSTAYPVNAGGVASDTSMHVATGSSCGGTQYTNQAYSRGGFLSVGVGASAGIILARKDSDGTTGIFTSSFTVTGNPDLPSGYTYYRVVAAWDTLVFSQYNAIIQPLGTVISGPGAPGQTLVSDGVHWGPSSLGPKAVWSGTVNYNALGVNSSSINTSTGLITMASSISPPLVTGMSLIATGTAPGGVTVNTGYYVCVVSTTTLQIYSTTQADAKACGSTGKVVPTTSVATLSFKYWTYTTFMSVGFDTVAPIGVNPGTTTMHWDFNLQASAGVTTNCLLHANAGGLVNTTPAAGNFWLFNTQIGTSAVVYYTCSPNVVSYINNAFQVSSNLTQGTWAQQANTAYNMEATLWAQ